MESETPGEGPAISVIVSTEDWRFQIVVLGKTLGSILDCDKIKPVNPKGNQPWIFIGRTDAEALILRSPDAKSGLFGEDPDSGKGWRQTEKRAAKHEIVRWPHRLNRHEFDQTLGDSRGQRSTVLQFMGLQTVRHDLPGSSPGGSREFEVGTALARIRKQLLN